MDVAAMRREGSMKGKNILIGIVGLVVLVVGGSVVATEFQNWQARRGREPLGPQVSATPDWDAVLRDVVAKDARDMEAKRGQPLSAGITYGMTLAQTQALLGAGHSPYSDGPIRPGGEEYKARFPAPGDGRSEVLVAYVHGGAYAAQVVPRGQDSFMSGMPGGTRR